MGLSGFVANRYKNPLNILGDAQKAANAAGNVADLVDSFESGELADEFLRPKEAFHPELEPLGDTGIYVTPNEPVDPRDCARWPNSPYCGGSGVEFDPYGLVPQVPEVNNCEICITVNPSLAFVSLPPYTVCYRFPDCLPEQPEEDEPLPEPDLNNEPLPPPSDPRKPTNPPTGYCRVVVAAWADSSDVPEKWNAGLGPNFGLAFTPALPGGCFKPGNLRFQYDVSVGTVSGVGYVGGETVAQYVNKSSGPILYWLTPTWDSASVVGGWIEERRYNPSGWTCATGFYRALKLPGEGFSRTVLYVRDVDSSTQTSQGKFSELTFDQVQALVQDREGIFSQLPGIQSQQGFYVPWSLVGASCNPKPKAIPPPPPPPPPVRSRGDDMPCNCEEIEEMLRGIYNRLGVEQYPVKVPRDLFDNASKSQDIGDLTTFFAWYVRQFDGVAGQWPIEIEIEDVDPTKEGNQKKKLSLPNIAETLAELFGLGFKSATNSDVSINFFLRLTAELLAVKNASIVAQDYARASAQWLGYKGNFKSREIDYAFDPDQLDTLDKLLTESKKKVVGWENQDRETLVSYLQKLMFSAGIIKAVFFRKSGDVERLLKEALNMSEDGSLSDADWELFIQQLKDPSSAYNVNSIPKPDVVDVGGDDDGA